MDGAAVKPTNHATRRSTLGPKQTSGKDHASTSIRRGGSPRVLLRLAWGNMISLSTYIGRPLEKDLVAW